MDVNGLKDTFPSLVKINITKNSNMKKNITEILSNLNQNNPVLVIGKSLALSKLLSIVEISKQQFHQEIDQQTLYQYNKMEQIEQEKTMESQESDLTIVINDIHSKPEKIPILYIILSKSPFDLPGWTNQTKS